jgi:hypothetical protein
MYNLQNKITKLQTCEILTRTFYEIRTPHLGYLHNTSKTKNNSHHPKISPPLNLRHSWLVPKMPSFTGSKTCTWPWKLHRFSRIFLIITKVMQAHNRSIAVSKHHTTTNKQKWYNSDKTHSHCSSVKVDADRTKNNALGTATQDRVGKHERKDVNTDSGQLRGNC